MQTITCVPEPTSASGGPSEELLTLRAIRTNLEAINANTDLVENLQAAGNNTLTAVQAYVDGLEGLLGGLQTTSSSLESLMSSLGINTDGIESLLTNLNTSSTLTSNLARVHVAKGWVSTAFPAIDFASNQPAVIVFYADGSTSPPSLVFNAYYQGASISAPSSTGVQSNLGGINQNWGLGEVPAVSVVNTPGSLQGTDDAVLTLPASTVRSLALFPTTQAVDYSTDGGVTYIRIATGSRVWSAQSGSTLDVSNMRFKGNAVGAIYDIIYEV